MSKNKNRQSPNQSGEPDRQQSEAAFVLPGYAAGNITNTGLTGADNIDKLVADGEAEAEALGNATVENKYNS